MKKRLILTLAATALLLPWIFFDIDLGDQSYHSLGSWLMAFHPKMPEGQLPFWFEQVPVWFSYFVDSLWWRVIGPDASLLSVRFGWLLCQLATLHLLYGCFTRLYPGRAVMMPLLFGLLAVNCAADQFVLSYYVVPPIFGALAFAFLAVAIQDEDPWQGLFAGVWAMFAIQSRLPSAPPILGGVAIIFGFVFFLQRDRALWRSFAGFMGGLLVGGLVSWACLRASGQAEYFLPGTEGFLHSVTSATHQRYSKGVVLERMLGHYTRIATGLGLFAAVMVGLRFFPERLRRFWLLAACAFAFLLALAKYGILLGMVIGGAVALTAISFWRNRPWNAGRAALFLGALGCLTIFTLGTYLEGIQNFKYGLWLLVPVALLETEDFFWRRWLQLAVFILFLTTRIFWPTFPFIEQPIFRLNAPFALAEARGIVSYPEKTRALEETVAELRKAGVKPGDDLLVYAGVPTYYPVAGVYLLSRTIPLLHDPGLIEYPGARWHRHRAAIEAMGEKLPRLVVREKKYFPRLTLEPRSIVTGIWTFRPAVADEPYKPTTESENGLAGDMDQLLDRLGYRVVWENAYFVILGRSGVGL